MDQIQILRELPKELGVRVPENRIPEALEI